MSKVEVTIRYAILNKSSELLGKMENYVKAKVNNGAGGVSDFKTKIIKGEKDKSITWNETFSVPLRPNNGAQIEFQVLDEDVTSDEVCGYGFFRLDSCGSFNSSYPQKYNIRLLREKTEEPAGSLHVSTRFV